MKFPTLCVIAFLVICFPLNAAGELYKYFDADHHICFTDDLTKVPESQRLTAQPYQEIKTAAPSSSPIEKPDSESFLTQNSEKVHMELSQESKKLETIKKELDREYEALKNRRNILLLDGKRQMDEKETKAFNIEARKLNEDTLKFKDKREIYLKQVKAFNQRVDNL